MGRDLTRCLPLTPDAADGADDRPDVHRVELLPSIRTKNAKDKYMAAPNTQLDLYHAILIFSGSFCMHICRYIA